MRRVCFIVAAIFPFLALADVEPYKDPSRPIDERVRDLVHRMSLPEKIDLLSGTGFATKANERLGIPELKMTDGPLGVRWIRSTSFGSGVSMASTFDRELVRKVTGAMALETRAHGRDMLLGPCVGITRVPFGGRNFEGMGEDPFLTSEIAAFYIKGLHDYGVVGSVKHFALNDQEINRMTENSIADERTMFEIHLPAFERAVEEDVGTVMASYNLVSGLHSTENAELLKILKEKWSFQGFVISDWESVHSTVRAALAGLDLEMPVGLFFNDNLLKAVATEEVSEDLIDEKVSRILKIIYKAGLFDGADTHRPPESVIGSPEHLEIARQLARESQVLLKNDGVLPLKNVKSLAVIGPNAAVLRTGGGGSSFVEPTDNEPLVTALRRELGERVVHYSRGVDLPNDYGMADDVQPENEADGKWGFVGEYFDNLEWKGEPKLKRVDREVSFLWEDGLTGIPNFPANNFSVRWTGKFVAPISGIYSFKLRADDGVRIYINDRKVIDFVAKNYQFEREKKIPLRAGQTYRLKVEYFQKGGRAEIRFGWRPPENKLLRHAIHVAAKADAVVLAVGFAPHLESEAQDRETFALPKLQDQLINEILKVNKKVIVAITTGNPVDMSQWINSAAAIIYTWYPGQEGGAALAEVLSGKFNPSGRLPMTLIRKWEDSPSYGTYPEKNGEVHYSEGIYLGYRYFDKVGVMPNFPFGHGLSYTHFNYSDLKISSQHSLATSPLIKVSATVTNSGDLPGAEVVQLYVNDREPKIDRPQQELKGFERIELKPGESKTVDFLLDKRSFAFYDVASHDWTVQPGSFEIRVGSSSRDIRLRGAVRLE